jgi:acetolactate synthase regulatory subunit
VSNLDREAIRAYLDATTPGPWEAGREMDGWRAGRLTVVRAGGKRVFTVDQTRPHHDDRAEANIEFAVRAHRDMPLLLDDMDRVSRELETMREVAQANRRHVEYLSAENERLDAELTRARNLAFRHGADVE